MMHEGYVEYWIRFWQERKKEQLHYIWELKQRFFNEELTKERFEFLVISASDRYNYISNKIKKLKSL